MIRPLLRDLQNGDEVLQECKVESLWATGFLSVGVPEQKITPETFESTLSTGMGSRLFQTTAVRKANMLYLGTPGRFLAGSVLGGIQLTTNYGASYTNILTSANNLFTFSKIGDFIIAIKQLGTTFTQFYISVDNGLTFNPYTTPIISVASPYPGPNDLVAYNGAFYYIQNLAVIVIDNVVPADVTSIITNPLQMRALFSTDTFLYGTTGVAGGLYRSNGGGFVGVSFIGAGGAAGIHFYVIKVNGITYSFATNGVFSSSDGITFTQILLPANVNGNQLTTTYSTFVSGTYNSRYDRIELVKYNSFSQLDFYSFDFNIDGTLSPIFKTSRLTCQEDLRTGRLQGVYFADPSNDTDKSLIYGVRNDSGDYTLIENAIADYPIINRATNSDTINLVSTRQISLSVANSVAVNELGTAAITTQGVLSVSNEGVLRYYYNLINTDIAGPTQLFRLRFDGSLADALPKFSNADFQIYWDVVTRQYRIQFANATWFGNSTYNHFYKMEYSTGTSSFSSNLNAFVANTPLYLATATAVSNITYNNTQATPMSITCYISPSSNIATNPTFLLTSFISSLGLVSIQIEKR